MKRFLVLLFLTISGTGYSQEVGDFDLLFTDGTGYEVVCPAQYYTRISVRSRPVDWQNNTPDGDWSGWQEWGNYYANGEFIPQYVHTVWTDSEIQARIVGYCIIDVPNSDVAFAVDGVPESTNPQKEVASTTEPINFISGNTYFSVKDINIPTPGISLDFIRYYNSAETNGSVLGKGWRHSYDWSLAVASNQVKAITSDARTYTFIRDTNGVYSASYDNNWQLVGQTNGEYLLLLPQGSICRFDTNGTLNGVSDGWDNNVSLVYSNSLLVSVEHSNGQSLDFTYSNGLLSAVTVATNLNLSLAYDANGALTGTVQQAGTDSFNESYSYDSSLLLTQRVDVIGNDYHYGYDVSAGKATSMYLTEGTQWYFHQVSYNGTTNAQVAYNRNGETIVHTYQINPFINRVLEERFDGIAGRIAYTYDSSANVIRKTTYATDENIWMQDYSLYDKQHNVTNSAFQMQPPFDFFSFPPVFPIDIATLPANITQYTWHPQWQVLTSVIDPEGFKIEYEYTNGVIALSRIYLSSNEIAEATYGYTTNGLLSAITNANGHSTAFTYDNLGYPETIVPQAGPTVTFGYDTLGHLTNSALPGQRETQYTVNPLGWVQQIDYADSLYETFQHNGLGDVTNHVDRAGRTTQYSYLPGGKLNDVTRQLGATNVTVSYDFDQQFNTLSIRDELNRPVESYGLDALDRPVVVTNLEGQTMSIRYLVGDFVDSITRFDGTTVSNVYTTDGFLASVAYPDETNRFTYLRNGLVRTLENSGGMVSNSWNQASWLTKAVSSAASVTSVVSYSYDPVGNVTNSSVNLQSTIINQQYTYDEAERLTVLLAEAQSTQRFVYAYNPDNGLVASVSNSNLRAEYEYDLMNRVVNIGWKDSWGTTLRNMAYSYNDAGMITQKITTASFAVSTNIYGYDDLDRLIYADGVEYSYDAAGNRLTKTGSDYSVSYTKGDGNRLQSWAATSTNGFDGFRTVRVEGHSSETIGTDNRWGQLWVSNTVAITPDINGTNFSINAFTVGLGTQTVVAAIRDQAGNVGYATNEIFLSVVTNAQYGYSEAGCLTNVAYTGTDYNKSLSLSWNSQYQLTSVSSAYSVVNYSYDVLGRRVSRVENGTTNFFVYDGNQVAADLDGSGNMLRSYVWGPGIDNLLTMTAYGATGTNTYYALKDHLNTVHALIDATGQIVERYEYDAWGRTTVFDASGKELSSSAIGNRYCFQGREIDWSTGLYHFRARTYDPVSGRWLSKDPIGISGGLNQYVFCGNNPINRIDPYGLVWYDDWHYEGRDAHNSNLPSSPAQATLAGGTQLSPEMSRYHDDPSTKGPELKFIFPDGREAVYNADTGQLVTDSLYKGTYNYVNPSAPTWNPLTWAEAYYRGIGHFLTDMLPYYIGGNERPSDSPCKK